MPDVEDRRPVVIVTGALAPYTHVLYDDLAGALDCPLVVLACSAREWSRSWQLPVERAFTLVVLPGLRWHRSTVTNHYFNPGVLSHPLIFPTTRFAGSFQGMRPSFDGELMVAG